MPKEIIHSQSAPTTGFTNQNTPSPLAQAIRAGDFLYVSGQGPLNPETKEVVSEDIREQTVQVLTKYQYYLFLQIHHQRQVQFHLQNLHLQLLPH